MIAANFGHWILGGLLVIFTSAAFFTRQFRMTAGWLGLVGIGLSILYYMYFFTFWPLLYFLGYLIVFIAFLLMALTFPAEALRDEVFDQGLGATSPLNNQTFFKASRALSRLAKWAGGLILAGATAWAILSLWQALAELPPGQVAPLKAEDYFIDLAVLSIFLLTNVVGLIFVFGTGWPRARN